MLRDYQLSIKNEIYDSWANSYNNTLAVLPTGAGKTIISSNILHEHNGPSCAIAHRQELVIQISLALAAEGLKHRIIGPKSVIKLAVNVHMDNLGRSFYDPGAPCAVAGVDTLIRRDVKTWANSVGLWFMDEAHHLLRSNKWGKAVEMFPNAKGLGVTATPLRADGYGLGAHNDGVFHNMCVGPGQRDLINMGYLTDYRLFLSGSDIDLSNVSISKTTGDYNSNQLRQAARKSKIIGDVVEHYKRIAPGKLGITFATDVETATNMARQFNESGVLAEVVSAKTPDSERVAILKKFKNRQLLQLINVDLFGEGFDLPAIEVVSMARPTQSYGLYVQQFGRGLRLMVDTPLFQYFNMSDSQRRAIIAASGKPHAIIIDHVGNYKLGLPDRPRRWSLDRREKRGSNSTGEILIRACPECMLAYERIHKVCPYCGYYPEPASRSQPEFVDGDLTEVDPMTLARMRGEIDITNMDSEAYRATLRDRHIPRLGWNAEVNRHNERQRVQGYLRDSIAWWAGVQRLQGKSDSESYRLFYFLFGVDVMTAQTLKRDESIDLYNKINKYLSEELV